MEPLFENTHVRDKKAVKALFRYYCMGRPVPVFIYCMAGVLLALWIFLLTIGERLILPPIIIVFCLLVPHLTYLTSVRATLGRMREVGGGDTVTTHISVTDADVAVRTEREADGETRVEFANLAYAKVTDTYIFLVTKSRLIFTLERDGFTLGNDAACIAFLRGKGIRVK